MNGNNKRRTTLTSGLVNSSGDRHRISKDLHPAWIALIRHCQKIEYGTIDRLKIQDGLPVTAEESVKRTKFL